VNGSTVTIDPGALAVYPYSAFGWSSFAPTNSQIIDILDARWIGLPGMQSYNALKNARIASITGAGTESATALTVTVGDITGLGLTSETLYVELLVAYPSQGLSNTPVVDYQATNNSFLVNNPSTVPNTTPYFFDQTLLNPTAPSAGAYYPVSDPSLVAIDWPHRETRLTYTTIASTPGSPAATFEFSADSETTNDPNFTLPERVEPGTVPTVYRNGFATTGPVTVDPTGRIITFTNPADYTSPGDTVQIWYQAIRPFPQSGVQVTILFGTRAPQTVRDPILGSSQQVTPRCLTKTLYTLTSGVSSPDYAYPYPQAYVQTGGIYAPTTFAVNGGEYELSGEALVSIADFDATTGMLALPTFVPFSPDPDQLTFLRAAGTDIDSEGRTFFKQVSGSVYLPNAYAQDLTDIRRHKNFTAFLAELATSSALGPVGMLVLVLLTRWAENDDVNAVFFDTNLTTNTTSASIFRLRTPMLNKRA
jgi:hypothetical protein